MDHGIFSQASKIMVRSLSARVLRIRSLHQHEEDQRRIVLCTDLGLHDVKMDFCVKNVHGVREPSYVFKGLNIGSGSR